MLANGDEDSGCTPTRSSCVAENQLTVKKQIYSVIAPGYPDVKYCRPASCKQVMAKIIRLERERV